MCCHSEAPSEFRNPVCQIRFLDCDTEKADPITFHWVSKAALARQTSFQAAHENAKFSTASSQVCSVVSLSSFLCLLKRGNIIYALALRPSRNIISVCFGFLLP